MSQIGESGFHKLCTGTSLGRYLHYLFIGRHLSLVGQVGPELDLRLTRLIKWVFGSVGGGQRTTYWYLGGWMWDSRMAKL